MTTIEEDFINTFYQLFENTIDSDDPTIANKEYTEAIPLLISMFNAIKTKNIKEILDGHSIFSFLWLSYETNETWEIEKSIFCKETKELGLDVPYDIDIYQNNMMTFINDNNKSLQRFQKLKSFC